MQQTVHLIGGETYFICAIDPQCEWYAMRHAFEGKLMRCVELFDEEEAAGFSFIYEEDCPDNYCFSDAFCFYRVKVKTTALLREFD